MRTFRRSKQDRSSWPMVNGLFLAVRALDLMSIQTKLNHVKIRPGVLYLNAGKLIGSHVFPTVFRPVCEITATKTKMSVRWRTYSEIALPLRHSANCVRIIS